MAKQPVPKTSPFAVIDIGTTSIRMAIAQIDEKGNTHPLDFLQQSLSLGHDTFTKGYIEKGTIGDCVRALRNFRRVCEEYGIFQEDKIRAVATTAVREALNREAFIDRLYIATGIRVEVIDNMDVARLTFLSARKLLKSNPKLLSGQVVLCEIGGGSTEMIVLEKGNIVSSHSFKLGALRLREMLDKFHAPWERQRTLMESEIRRTIDQVLHAVPKAKNRTMIALGGDMRFAAAEIIDNWDAETLAQVPIKNLEVLTKEVLLLSVDNCVKKFKVSYPDAETLSPALLFYTMLARGLSVKTITACDISMRHGILLDMAKSETHDENFRQQILRSAWETAKKYNADEQHALSVMTLCTQLFTNLADEHQLPPWYGLILAVAAILHDIGMFVSTRGHHKHSMYCIQNSEIFGLSRRDILLISLLARYHRKATPKMIHPEYVALDREDRLAVAKCAAILRIADSLDRSHSQRISKITCRREKDSLVIVVPGVEDLTLEQLGIQTKGDMFEEVYGMNVVLERK
jgi:exopolyphosphatase/guanosine-5'-triphosphate,3'-diphosphate pyrophosphatase